MKYFVTGATGFVGGRVVRRLVEAGHQVAVVARNPAKATDVASLGVEIHQGDVTEKESMRAPMQGVDGVFHIAGWYKIGVKDKSEGARINIQGTRNVLELMQELGIARGVYTSTLAVFSDTHGRMVDETYRYDGPHLSEYDRTKWVAHYEVAEPMIEAGLPLVIVQPGVIYGPGDTSSLRTAFVQYLQRKLPMMPGRTAFCWAHVDDIARGHILAMQKGTAGQTYIMDKQQLLKRLEKAWAAIKESYAGLSDSQLTEPGVMGNWSVKDILAHVTTWEEEALKYLPLIITGGRPPRYIQYGGIDAFNAQMTEQKRGLALSDVLRQLDETHRRLIDYIRSVPEEHYTRETRFRHRLRLDTYSHYPKHAKAIREWRERPVE